MSGWAYIENIITMLVMAAIILGVWAMGGGGWGFWSLVLLLNLNHQK